MDAETAHRFIQMLASPAHRRLRLLAAAIALEEGTIPQLAAFAGWNAAEARAVIVAEPELFSFGEPSVVRGATHETFRMVGQERAEAEIGEIERQHPEFERLQATSC
jgi:hypothetical protein